MEATSKKQYYREIYPPGKVAHFPKWRERWFVQHFRRTCRRTRWVSSQRTTHLGAMDHFCHLSSGGFVWVPAAGSCPHSPPVRALLLSSPLAWKLHKIKQLTLVTTVERGTCCGQAVCEAQLRHFRVWRGAFWWECFGGNSLMLGYFFKVLCIWHS